jgi:3-hydroxy-3-methylglutaryl CoA synthase
MIGITAFGAYVPRLRLSRKAIVEANAWAAPGLRAQGKGERAICNWDEDSLTMAVEAARDCLAGDDRGGIAAVNLASTSLPFEDRSNSGIVAQALNLGEDVETLDVTSSQRAGTSGLLAALRALSPERGPVLFVASDNRRTKAGGGQELAFGDGAAALLLGSRNVIAAFKGAHSVAVDFVDHYRGQNREFDYNWEERWIRDEGYMKIVPKAVQGALERAGIAAAEIDHFVLPCTLARVAQSIAKRVGIAEGSVRENLHMTCGEAGTAHALLMLVDAIQDAKPGDKILVASFGQGCDALIFEVTDALAKLSPRLGVKGYLSRRRKEETNYAKFLAFNNLTTREKGMRAELDNQTALTQLYRRRQMLLGLVGGRCKICGTRQFPKTNVCVNPNCGAFKSQEDEPFAETPCRVVTWSADHLTYTMDPPAHYGMVQFEEGGRFLANFTDVDVGNVSVGMPMRMMFRIKDYDDIRGFRRYFWKAAPAFDGRT